MVQYSTNNRPAARLILVLAATLFSGLIRAEPEEVVVVGTALNTLVTHVSSIVSVNRENQIARWNRSLCVRVEGLPEEHHRILRERLAQASQSVRISLLDAGCAENVLLFFASDAGTVSQQLAQHFEIPLRQDGIERVQDFVASEAPVRWINTFNRCGFGCRLANSRITASSAPSVDFMLLVVDVTHIEERHFRDVADYLAFVILSNPSPQPKPAVDSILSLFNAPQQGSSPEGLSVYDQLYLEALYSVPMDRFLETQRNAISGRMLTRLNASQ
jgi:hypothetical protein